MPDHVHSLLHFQEQGMLSQFIQQWKRRSSIRLKQWIKDHLPAYAAAIDIDDPIWRARYHDFNCFSREKINEKLEYMHNNPVKAGLLAKVEDWKHEPARRCLFRRPVGIRIARLL
jgi:putative transposase